MTTFFTICFLILPWVIIPNDQIADPFRLPKSTFFDLICMGMICFSLAGGLRKRYFNKYLSWFSIWVFFTIFLNFYLPYTMTFNNRSAINLTTLMPTLHFIFGLWASYIALSYFEIDDFFKISKVICISSILISSVAILQKLGLDIFGQIAKYSNPYNKFSAFLDNPNIVGNYLCLTIPFFLLKENKKYIAGLVLAIIGLIISLSELSILCAVAGLLTYLLFINRKKITYIAVSLFVLSGIGLVWKNQSILLGFMNTRLALWRLAWVEFKDNPIFGQGLGIFKSWELYPNMAKSLVAHNDWFEITIMLGVVGLVLLLMVIINSIRKFNYKIDNRIGFAYFTSFISFLLLMVGSFPLEIAPLALFGLVNIWGVETL